MPNEEQTWSPELLDAPHDVPDKAGRVRRMFNSIAPRYELINSVFSAGRDAAWRRKAVELAGTGCHDDVLDIGCGTGDFARAFASSGARTVVGCDFAHEMLIRAARSNAQRPAHRTVVGRQCEQRGRGEGGQSGSAGAKMETGAPGRVCPVHLASKRESGMVHWCEADALYLPFRSGCFSITSCAFSVRNFSDLDAGLAEMFRVLKPGGRAVILEFTRPRNRLARFFYELYSRRFMPTAAALLSGDRSGAYRYLPRSVVSFLDAEQMGTRLRRAGFAHVVATPLTLGVVTVCVATRE